MYTRLLSLGFLSRGHISAFSTTENKDSLSSTESHWYLVITNQTITLYIYSFIKLTTNTCIPFPGTKLCSSTITNLFRHVQARGYVKKSTKETPSEDLIIDPQVIVVQLKVQSLLTV